MSSRPSWLQRGWLLAQLVVLFLFFLLWVFLLFADSLDDNDDRRLLDITSVLSIVALVGLVKGAQEYKKTRSAWNLVFFLLLGMLNAYYAAIFFIWPRRAEAGDGWYVVYILLLASVFSLLMTACIGHWGQKYLVPPHNCEKPTEDEQ